MKINLFKKLAVLSLLGLGIGGLVSCNPTGETVVEVKTGTVDLKFESSQGTVTASKKEGNVGDTITLTVTPADGYHVVSVTANGTALTGPNYAFELQEGTNVVRAEFAKDPTIALAANAQAFKAHLTYELTATVADAPVQNYVVKFTHNAGDNLTGTTEGNKFTFKATATGSYKIQAGAYENAQATTAFATTTFDLTVAQGVEKYSLVLDTAAAKTAYKQGETFTSAGLAVKKEFSVDGTKVSEQALTLSEVNISLAEGYMFTEVGEVSVTVSDVEEVAEAATFKVNVAEDKEWQVRNVLNNLRSKGFVHYEAVTVEGQTALVPVEIYDAEGRFFATCAGDGETWQVYYEGKFESGGKSYDEVFHIEVDSKGVATAQYFAQDWYADADDVDIFARGETNKGLFSDFTDEIAAALTYDQEADQLVGGTQQYALNEGRTAWVETATSVPTKLLAKITGANEYFPMASGSGSTLAFNSTIKLAGENLVRVLVTGTLSENTYNLGVGYYAPFNAEDATYKALQTAIEGKTYGVNASNAIKAAVATVLSNNYHTESEDMYFDATFTDTYTYFEAKEEVRSYGIGSDGYFTMPEGKADAENNKYSTDTCYAFTMAIGEDAEGNPTYEGAVGDPETSALADLYYARPSFAMGFKTSPAGIPGWIQWNKLYEKVDEESGETSFGYTYFQTTQPSSSAYLNYGSQTELDIYANARGLYYTFNDFYGYGAKVNPHSYIMEGVLDSEGAIKELELTIFMTNANDPYAYGCYETVVFSDIGTASVSYVEDFINGIADYVEPTPDPEGGEGGEGGESGGSEGGSEGGEGGGSVEPLKGLKR